MAGKKILIAAVVGAILTGVAWQMLYKEPGDAGATQPAAPSAPVAANENPQTPHPPVSALPAEHPPINQGGAGTVTPDPDSQYTHFQVGERNVRRLMIEGDVVWVGTSGGVIRYNTATDEFRHFSTTMGLIANGVFHLSRWHNKIAIGTYGGGLSLLDESNETFTHYNIPEGLADAFVYDMVVNDDGDMWIATWSGANLILDGDLDNPDKWQTFTVENTNKGLPNDWVYALSRGENGVIWFATEGGLARYRDGAWDNWNHADGLGADYELVKDDIQFKNDPAQYSEHHSTWGGGLARFDGESWTNYTTKDGLPSNHVFMVYEGRDGRLWVGTGKGLARLEDDGSFTVFTTADGLFSDIIFSMVEAEDGTFWIGSFGGVTHIKSLP